MLPLELIFQRSANGGGSFRRYHAIHEKISLLDLEADLVEARKEGRDAADHHGIAAHHAGRTYDDRFLAYLRDVVAQHGACDAPRSSPAAVLQVDDARSGTMTAIRGLG